MKLTPFVLTVVFACPLRAQNGALGPFQSNIPAIHARDRAPYPPPYPHPPRTPPVGSPGAHAGGRGVVEIVREVRGAIPCVDGRDVALKRAERPVLGPEGTGEDDG